MTRSPERDLRCGDLSLGTGIEQALCRMSSRVPASAGTGWRILTPRTPLAPISLGETYVVCTLGEMHTAHPTSHRREMAWGNLQEGDLLEKHKYKKANNDSIGGRAAESAGMDKAPGGEGGGRRGNERESGRGGAVRGAVRGGERICEGIGVPNKVTLPHIRTIASRQSILLCSFIEEILENKRFFQPSGRHFLRARR